MSIENKVFEILSTKVELQSQKIELALIDDGKKLAGKLELMADNVASDGENYLLFRSKVEDLGQKLINELDNVDRIVDNLTLAYKQLGLEAGRQPEIIRLNAIKDTIITYRKRYNF
jgi:hypothetical protein